MNFFQRVYRPNEGKSQVFIKKTLLSFEERVSRKPKLEFWAPQNRPKAARGPKVVLSLEFWGSQKEPKSTQSVQNRQSVRKVVLALEKRTPKRSISTPPSAICTALPTLSRPSRITVPHGNQVSSSPKVVYLCRHGLVLLDLLPVAVLKSIQSGICR